MDLDETFELRNVDYFDAKTGKLEKTSLAVQNGKYVPTNPSTSSVKKRLILVSGLTDLHTHLFHGQDLGIHAEEHLLTHGVTSAVDAGSAGGHLFAAFRELVIDRSKVAIKALLNISSVGTTSVRLQGELVTPKYVDLDLAINTIHEHADVIIGIKVRASCDAGGANTDNALAIAREAADKVGLPLMIHLGPAPSDVDTILENLGSGDILTHSFTGWRGNTLLDDGKPRKAFQSAVKRGVNIDVGHGAGGFDSTVAKSILNHGFLPDTISTDLHSGSIGKVLSLANVMSKFLALGMSLEEVLHCTITKPNQIAGFRHIEDQFSIGNPATFTLFEIEEGQFNFADVHGHNFSGNVRIKPTFTIHNGEIISNSLQDLE